MSLGSSKSLAAHSNPLARPKSRPYLLVAAAAATLAASALVNYFVAKKAERDNPPKGKFVDIDDVRLHFIERGKGEPLVLLHGNGSMVQDFESSGLIDLAAKSYRVIIFDRPGFGHSVRPHGTVWTPEAQADVIYRALKRIGITDATVLGHSWGASVAVALALKYPEVVRSLVLASGYYYPTVRSDVVVMSGPALPIIGTIWSYTIAPLLGRMMWPMVTGKLFSPKPVPMKFRMFPKEMALRPAQIQAGAAEAALMIPDAFAYRGAYKKLKMPVVIIAGEKDKIVDIDQSEQLHREITHSVLHGIPGAGHMVHHTETHQVMSAIDEAAGANPRSRPAEFVPNAA